MSNQSKYEIVNVKDVKVTVDVSLLQKTDELFFNATEIAKFAAIISTSKIQ